jgi:hypothetical protein
VYTVPTVPYKDPQRQRASQREWCAKNRREWLEANGPCVDCGSWIDLEVDHNDRSSKTSHSVWSWSPTRRKHELAKCSPRCKVCHKAKTNREVYGERQHGTSAMWRRAGCRCDECRRYKRVEQAAYRAKR